MSITLLSLRGIQYGAELQSYEFITIFLKNETILFKTKGMKQHLSLISKSLEMFFFSVHAGRTRNVVQALRVIQLFTLKSLIIMSMNNSAAYSNRL